MATIILPVDFGKTTDTLLTAAVKFAKEIKGKILEAIEDFRKDYEQNDDITFVILKSVKK